MKITYEVLTTVYDSAIGAQIKVVAGTFNNYMNAKLFAKAYADYYNASTEILERT